MQYPMISRIHVRRDVESLQTQQVVIYIPSQTDCPVCGWDEFARSGLDVSCSTCEGTGKVTSWRNSRASARVMWIDPAAPVWGVVASGDVGDVWLSVSTSFKNMFDTVEETEGAYILVDGETVKPISVTYNRVQGTTSVDVRCKIVKVN